MNNSSEINDHESVVDEVVPFEVPDNAHKKLLSLLKPLPSPHFKMIHTTIPILKGTDVSEILRSNTVRMLNERSKATNKSNSSHSEQTTTNENEQPQWYKSIDELIPTNLQQQLTTVAITYFPPVKPVAIERILSTLIGNRGYIWSMLNYEYLDNRLLFIRFSRVEDTLWFIQMYSGEIGSLLLNDEISLVHQDVSEYTESGSGSGSGSGTEVPEDIKDTIDSLLHNVTNYERVSVKTGTEDLDQVMDYYSRYKVDNNELIDVPSHMKEGIVKDIIKFRSKVLNIERDKRKKEIEVERAATKERLKKLYEGIKETRGDTPEQQVLPVQTPSVTIPPQEYPELSEQEYEEYLSTQQQQQLDQTYTAKLAQVQATESSGSGLRNLQTKLEGLKSYESDLIDNKEKYYQQVVDVVETVGTYTASANALTTVVNMYYTDHQRYTAERSRKRTAEQMADEADREQEQQEVPVPVPVEQVPVPVIPVSVLPVSAPPPQLIAKINELLVEYLGVEDDMLFDTILDNVTRTKDKQQLIVSLSEVLEEDAQSLVDDLWNYIENELQLNLT
ncbi:U1 small nuclear ribonucleoprotein component SNU71 [Scheffersomyces amazonensis]|uniref:U1 small nuclear ribonucleoprotein component SNU71 n=1 Tax=Scheffersomyces amazonensis TaxID=1078765 RepID=UPI00315D2E81